MKPVVVRHLKTNVPYQYLGQNVFRNLVTGVEGIVSDEVAQKCFVINLDATEILHWHPIVEELISVLQLRFDK